MARIIDPSLPVVDPRPQDLRVASQDFVKLSSQARKSQGCPGRSVALGAPQVSQLELIPGGA